MNMFNLSREEMEAQASIVWALAVEKMYRDGTITKEQAASYENWTVVIVMKDSVIERLKHFFSKAPKSQTTMKFKLINLNEGEL